MKKERLHKILAARGVASRRASEELIAAGRVWVDGKPVTQMGTLVSPDADIRVDGQPVREPKKVYYMLNKPRGYLTTLSDERGRRSVADIIKPLRGRVYPVGRLDTETEGLLLLTNDGELTHTLTHPRFKVEKTYIVIVKSRMDEEAVDRLRKGIFLKEGKVTAHVKIIKATRDSTGLEMTITQGYNRQIRRMCAAVGFHVKRLERVRFGPLRLRGLPRGAFRLLSKDETAALRELAASAATRSQGASSGANPRRAGR